MSRRRGQRAAAPRRPRPAGERGAITIIVAVSLTVLLLAAALSFDLGRLVDANRSMQAVADAVALDAADFLDGTAPGTIDPYAETGAYDLDQVVQYEASESALRNGYQPSGSTFVALGTCSSSVPCAFQPVEDCPYSTTLGSSTCTVAAGASASTVVNAVEMTASTTTDYDLTKGAGTSVRTATAVRQVGPPATPVSSIAVGSTLLGIDPTILNSVLGQELGGSTLDVTADGYEGLAGADVSVAQILEANASAGTVEGFLSANTSLPMSTLLGYVENALDAEGQTSAAADLAGVTATGSVTPCELIDLQGDQSSCEATGSTATSAAYATFNVLSLLTGAAALAGEGHAVDLSVSGLGILEATVTAISPPAGAGPGPADDPCPTDGTATCPVTATDTQDTVSLTLGDGALSGVAGLQLEATGADATATLTGATCSSSPADDTATVSGSTEAATISGTVDLLDVPVSLVSGDIGGGSFSHTFDGPFTATSPAPWSSTDTDPTVSLSAPGASGLLDTLLSTLLDTLDPVLSPLLQALGVDLGYATVGDNYVGCSATVLAA